MASRRFNDLQAQIEAKLEKLKNACDDGEKRVLLADLRKLIADLEREVQGGRSRPEVTPPARVSIAPHNQLSRL